MRLLLASDLHTDRSACDRLVAMADAADLVLIAGDLASQHRELEPTVAALSGITAPVALVPGNNETEPALRSACAQHWPHAVVLHGGGTIIAGLRLFGLGAGVPPIGQGWSFDLEEHEADALLERCHGCDVLLTHAPPLGHADTVDGRHVGSAAILRATTRLMPRLHVFGHIHACWEAQETLGSTTLINAGPRGVWFDA